ncbi:MAG: hypothetical protein CM15mP113_2430 [Pseudomonadota bacterium]|nr:MAG: hypothetical protein CM15mP113_2430 [Pseudomonadota bacterium]
MQQTDIGSSTDVTVGIGTSVAAALLISDLQVIK